MKSSFEVEIWSDIKKMKRILLYIAGISILAWIVCIIGKISWNDNNVEVVSTLRGKTKYVGWPVKLFYYGMFIGIAGTLSFIIVRFTMDNKHPLLALNSEGIYINQQLIKQTLVKWNNIQNVEFSNEGNHKVLSLTFKNTNEIIDAQSSSKKAFLKENLKDGKPLICKDQFAKGDFTLFHEKAKQYLT